ncbi:MAG: AAA family ATPase [Nitrospirae bacterium]|nr:AAA family ATPase [Nitrospirota bacterium]
MKIAITGKGGVGKTTLSAILSHLFSRDGKTVIAVDADPDANLAAALGISESDLEGIRPIAEMADLIEQRTGARPGSAGGIFKLNPKVDDIPDACSRQIDGIKLLVMGKSKEASSGCFCPESVFLKHLLRHIILNRDDVVIVDMEAGIEHLTRGTAEAVDFFIVVVEPGKRSIQTALHVRELAKGLGIKDVFVVANKIKEDANITFIKDNIEDMKLIGSISYNQDIIDADIKGISPFGTSQKTVDEIRKIKESLDTY